MVLPRREMVMRGTLLYSRDVMIDLARVGRGKSDLVDASGLKQ